MSFDELLINVAGFLPFWLIGVFLVLVVFLFGILVFKLVAFVMDVLPFV